MKKQDIPDLIRSMAERPGVKRAKYNILMLCADEVEAAIKEKPKTIEKPASEGGDQ